MTADTITANDKVTVGSTDDKQTVIDGNAGTVTVGTGDNQTKIDATNGTVTVGDSDTNKYTEIGSGNLHVHTNIGGVNGGVLANNIGLQVYNENGDQVWISNEGTVYITSNGNSVTLANGTGTFTNDNGTTSIDGGNVEVGNQITVGGADGTVINNGSVSINNNSAYFRENAMKVGSMTYDGLSNTLNMGGAGRLTGLADGGVYMGSTDAVTGNQLWQAYKRMDQLQESINIVGAHAAALSGLHPIDYNPYEPTTLSAAIGTYHDEYAVAVGVFHYVRENVLFNLGASICSDGDLMGRAGISFTVGRGGDKKKALAPKDMNEVQAQLAEVRQACTSSKPRTRPSRSALTQRANNPAVCPSPPCAEHRLSRSGLPTPAFPFPNPRQPTPPAQPPSPYRRFLTVAPFPSSPKFSVGDLPRIFMQPHKASGFVLLWRFP